MQTYFDEWFKTHSNYVVTFEGPKGSGKTKHAKLFTQWLNDQVDYNVLYISNPFKATVDADEIRHKWMSCTNDVDALLYSVLNKRLLQSYIINYTLNHPKTIFVVDRWNLSMWVYQVAVPDLMHKKMEYAMWALDYPDEVIPNYQVLLDASETTLNSRFSLKEVTNRYETPEYIAKSVQEYHRYACNCSDMQVVNTDIGDVSQTQNVIRDMFLSKIGEEIG